MRLSGSITVHARIQYIDFFMYAIYLSPLIFDLLWYPTGLSFSVPASLPQTSSA